MTVRLPLVAALALVSFGASAGPAAAALQGDQEIGALNGQRALNGLPNDVTENVDWSIGCAKHMAWTQLNGLAHDEPVGSQGYTPDGDEAGNGSVLTSGGASFTPNGANAFQHAPIHLMQMLSPFLKTSGAADGCLATQRDTDRTFPSLTTFSYPGDGGVALTSETAFEGPFVPGDFVGLPYPTVTGPHLYFYAAKPGPYSWYYSRGQITSASLTKLGVGDVPVGGPLPVKTVDNTTKGTSGAVAGQDLGNLLPAGGIVIPVSPLVSGSKYQATVNFSFTPEGPGNVSRTWKFTASNTLPLPTVPAPSRAPLNLAPVVKSTPTPTATPTPTPVATATPTPTPTTPSSPGPGMSPVKLTQIKLKARSLLVKASRDATVWVVIEQKKITGKGKKRKTKWSVRDAFAMAVLANQVGTVKHKKLTKGDYRITFRLDNAKGAVQLVKPTKVK